MNRNTRIAAAVAAILGTTAGTGTVLAAPTLQQAQQAPVTLYIAGSSAAKNAVIAGLQADLCGGASNALTFSSTSNGNFFAVSCVPASGVGGGDGSTVFTVYYRDEGGSVVGALPIVNSVAINQLDLSQVTSCGSSTACTVTVVGGSSTNGTDDSFAGPLTKQFVQLGIMDVEPSALATANNYPTPYSTTVWGAKNPNGLVTLNGSASPLFGEVYAVFVNNKSAPAGGGTNPLPSTLMLSQQMLQQLLTRSVTNWNVVQDIAGNPVTSTSLAVTVVNREQGSGSRTATDLLLAGDTCQTQGKNLIGSTGYFATSDVLNAANSVAGAITYATIDQSASNMSQVALNGITPTNLAAASGQYPFWVEATVVKNPNITFSPTQNALISFFTSAMQAVATAPHVADVLAIPGIAGNTASVSTGSNGNTTTVPGLGTATIYVNPFSRGKVTCNLPTYSP
jgi:hypothetical protein